MIATKNEKGLSRIDSGSTHGWFVRAYKNGKTFSKLFSDKKLGGKKESYQAALEHRNALMQKLESIPTKPRKRRLVYNDSRNATGVLGVCRTTKRSPNGSVNDCYSVSWRPEPGVQKCTSFSIRKYGEKKAFELAVAHRYNMIREIYGSDVLRKMRKSEQDSADTKENPQISSSPIISGKSAASTGQAPSLQIS